MAPTTGGTEHGGTTETPAAAPSVCGNGVVEPGEVCLGKFVRIDAEDLDGFHVADFDADGRSDLANHQRVLFQRAGGAFESVPVADLAGPRTYVGDVNGDGRPDLLGYDGTAGEIRVAVGDGTGKFTSPVTTGIGSFTAIHVLDMNDDGRADLLGLADAAVNPLRTWASDGVGSFEKIAQQSISGFDVAAGDFDGDHDVDLAVSNLDSLGLWWRDRNDYAAAPPVPQLGLAGAAVVDLDHDGQHELLVAYYQAQLAVLSGVYVAWPTRGSAHDWRVVGHDLDDAVLTAFPVAGDLDNDGVDDLLVVRQVENGRTLDVLCTDLASDRWTVCASMDFDVSGASLTAVQTNEDSAMDLVSAVEGGGVWRMLADP